MYLLLTKFDHRTVSYGLSFSHHFMAQVQGVRAINRRGKQRSVNLLYGPRKKVMLIGYLYSSTVRLT